MATIVPGGDMIGLDDDRLGIASHIAREAQQLAILGDGRS
jgi:hypothetical protein